MEPVSVTIDFQLLAVTNFFSVNSDCLGMTVQVVPENENAALYSTHSFKILFKEGGCGTFIPLFFNLLSSVRQYNQQQTSGMGPQMNPLVAAQTPVDEMMRHA